MKRGKERKSKGLKIASFMGYKNVAGEKRVSQRWVRGEGRGIIEMHNIYPCIVTSMNDERTCIYESATKCVED